jgi:hypothetical protein
MEQIVLKADSLNGKTIVYNSATVFMVQVGRGSKGSYKTNYRFVGNLRQAFMYYDAINIGRGYKKRLIGVGLNNSVLARETSAVQEKRGCSYVW